MRLIFFVNSLPFLSSAVYVFILLLLVLLFAVTQTNINCVNASFSLSHSTRNISCFKRNLFYLQMGLAECEVRRVWLTLTGVAVGDEKRRR